MRQPSNKEEGVIDEEDRFTASDGDDDEDEDVDDDQDMDIKSDADDQPPPPPPPPDNDESAEEEDSEPEALSHPAQPSHSTAATANENSGDGVVTTALSGANDAEGDSAFTKEEILTRMDKLDDEIAKYETLLETIKKQQQQQAAAAAAAATVDDATKNSAGESHDQHVVVVPPTSPIMRARQLSKSVDMDQASIIERIYRENAARAKAALAKEFLLPVTRVVGTHKNHKQPEHHDSESGFSDDSTSSDSEPEQVTALEPASFPFYQDNLLKHETFKTRLHAHLHQRRQDIAQKEQQLRDQYLEMADAWQAKIIRYEEQLRRRMAKQQYKNATRSKKSGGDEFSGAYGSAYDTDLALHPYEYNPEDDFRYLKTLVQPTPMMLDEKQRLGVRYVNTNARLDDSTHAIRQRNHTENPWTQEERAVFLQKYMEFPKEFGRIAEWLPNKSSGDCVLYYYLNKKALKLRQVTRQALAVRSKKRRKQAQQQQSQRERDGQGQPGEREREFDDGRSSTPFSRDVSQEPLFDATALMNDQSGSMVFREDSVPLPSPLLNHAMHPYPPDAHHDDPPSAHPRPPNPHTHAHPSNPSNRPGPSGLPDDTKWTQDEMERARVAFRAYGRDFYKVAEEVGTRTIRECRRLFGEFRRKLGVDLSLDEGDGGGGGDGGGNASVAAGGSVSGGDGAGGGDVGASAESGLGDVGQGEVEQGGQDEERGGDEDEPTREKSVQLEEDVQMEVDPTPQGSTESLEVAQSTEEDVKDVSDEKQVVSEQQPQPQQQISMTEKRRSRRGRPRKNEEELSRPASPAVPDDPGTTATTSGGTGGKKEKRRTVSYWTAKEKSEFLRLYPKYGKDWKAIAEVLQSKSEIQIRNYFQNNKLALGLHDVDGGASSSVPGAGSAGSVSTLAGTAMGGSGGAGNESQQGDDGKGAGALPASSSGTGQHPPTTGTAVQNQPVPPGYVPAPGFAVPATHAYPPPIMFPPIPGRPAAFVPPPFTVSSDGQIRYVFPAPGYAYPVPPPSAGGIPGPFVPGMRPSPVVNPMAPIQPVSVAAGAGTGAVASNVASAEVQVGSKSTVTEETGVKVERTDESEPQQQHHQPSAIHAEEDEEASSETKQEVKDETGEEIKESESTESAPINEDASKEDHK